MSFVITLTNYRPVQRYDGMPWVSVIIEEAAVSTGPWEEIDAQPLDPVDNDPTDPLARSFTTAQAQIESGWYRITFVDNDDNRQPTNPVHSSPLIPTALDVREWSLLEFDQYGWAGSPDPLQRLVDVQIVAVENAVKKKFDSDTEPAVLSMMQEAVKLATEWAAVRAAPENIEAVADFDIIKSFRAGSYSEERRSMHDSAEYHPWPALNDLLKAIVEGSADGFGNVPSVGGPCTDWERQRYIIDARRRDVPNPHDMRPGGMWW